MKKKIVSSLIVCLVSSLVLLGCTNRKTLITQKLALASVIINGKSVSFDNRKDTIVYELGKTDVVARVQLEVVEYDNDVSCVIRNGTNVVINSGQVYLDKNITPLVITITNIEGKSRNVTLYLAKGKLPDLVINDNLFLETALSSRIINDKKVITLNANDFTGTTFSGAVGDDLLKNGKAKIINIENLEENNFNTLASLQEHQDAPSTITLKLTTANSVELAINGKFSDIRGSFRGFIDVLFDKTAFVTPVTEPDANQNILYKNTYVFRYHFGDSIFMLTSTPLFIVDPAPKNTSATKINFQLLGNKFNVDGDLTNNDYFTTINLPYDYELHTVINPNRQSGYFYLKRKHLFLKTGIYSFVVKLQPALTSRNFGDLAGSAVRLLLQVP